MVLIWALPHPRRKGARPTVQDIDEMQRRSLILLHELRESNSTIVVPTITASELLAGIEPVHHGRFLAELQDQFMLAPFDLPASSLAASLFQFAAELPKEEKPTRMVLKADVMIVASAKTAGATQFYSHEPRVRKIVERAGMEPKDLPTQGSSLFTEEEMKLPPKKKPK